MTAKIHLAILAAFVLTPFLHAETKELPAGVTRVPVTFSGGHETDERDRGRPVVLIAAALGVSSEVFRDAFSGVRPAGPDRGPTGEEARKNKAVLMAALGKHGITNERLDEVSNYYRYQRGRGEIWTSKPAEANALVKDGKITGYELVSGGAGYSSVPTISVAGFPDAKAKVEVAYGKDLATNGAVSVLALPEAR